mmetsp:Transcript_3817/g.11786  ORF Transcript_3817/g.11786 Transcript_3817/m.11786 type:complete len:81 (+) Transcript_3817:1217-1459(+)|eukprot:scaffold229337_cov33-Tisochrysis_lutea.AAC.3
MARIVMIRFQRMLLWHSLADSILTHDSTSTGQQGVLPNVARDLGDASPWRKEKAGWDPRTSNGKMCQTRYDSRHWELCHS